ncbi:hypothetical protein MMC25_007360 [Agyrium rufum]|nr:hypothetical protein [Agyrium rufum]
MANVVQSLLSSLLLITFLPHINAEDSVVHSSHASNAVAPRILRAATPTAHAIERGLDVILRQSMQLHYVEEDASKAADSLSAMFEMSSTHPVLLLEEIEHMLDEVHCEAETLELVYTDPSYLNNTLLVLPIETNFIVITSHWSCNDEHDRAPYRVTKLSSAHDGSVLKLSVESVTWEEILHGMTVTLGRSGVDYSLRTEQYYRRRRDLSMDIKRQEATSVSASAAASATSTPVDLPGLYLPAPADTVDIVSNVTASLSSFYAGQLLPIPNSSFSGPEVSSDLTISCANCSTSGTIELLGGSFTFDYTQDSTDPTSEPRSAGFVELSIDNLSAHVELGFSWPEYQKGNLTIEFPKIPIAAIVVAELFAIGPTLKPVFILQSSLEDPLNFISGFETSISPNSSIYITLDDSFNSSIEGFEPSFNLLPFNSDEPAPNFELGVGFKPEIEIGVSVGDFIDLGVGAYLELPLYNVSVESVSNVNYKCELYNETDSAAGNILYNNLTLVTPQVDILGGVFGDDKFLFWGGESDLQLLDLQFPLATHCLMFDAQASEYSTVPTPAAKGETSATSGASRSKGDLYGGKRDSFFSVQSAVFLLTGVFLSFSIFL